MVVVVVVAAAAAAVAATFGGVCFPHVPSKMLRDDIAERCVVFAAWSFGKRRGVGTCAKALVKSSRTPAEFSPAAVDSVQGVRVQGVWGGEGWRSGKDGYLKESLQGLTARRRGSNY